MHLRALGPLSSLAVVPSVAPGQAEGSKSVPAPLRRFAADSPDSLVPERTSCIVGHCAAYRVSLGRQGQVRLGPPDEDGGSPAHADSLTPLTMLYLMGEAVLARVDKLSLPLKRRPSARNESSTCRPRMCGSIVTWR